MNKPVIRKREAHRLGRLLLACAHLLLIVALLLSASVAHADDPIPTPASDKVVLPPEPTKEPPPTPVALPAEPVTQTMTEDGRVVVIIFLKEQPLHEASQEVRAEYEPRFEALRAQMQAVVPEPWEGQSFATVKEEQEAVRAAPEPSAAQRDEIEALSAQMDALDTEMRREMMERARPRLEASQAELVQAIENLGGQVLYRYATLNGVAAAIPPEARAAIEARHEVAEVVDDQLMSGHLNVSVPSIYASTWWSAGYDGGAWDVGVVDSGIDDNHPALSSQTFYQNRCLATADAVYPGMPGTDPTVDDVNGHGTHVAGIVASTNSTYRGVAYGLDGVLNLKAGFDLNGSDGGFASMYWSDSMACVDWGITTAGDDADTLNLSYGGSTSSDDTSFARFWDAVVDDLRVPSTISAGNDGPSAYTLGDPSVAYNVLCVANMDDRNTTGRSDDTILTSSSRGPTVGGRKKPDITAPGTHILSCDNSWEGATPDFVSYSGTSMAAPHVAGANLLMVDYYGLERPMAQKAILINTAEDRGAADWDSTYGWGYMDLDHAYFHRNDWFRSTISPEPDYDFYVGPAYNGDTATLVWHRRAVYAGSSSPSTYYDLSDLDLYMYREDTGAEVDSSFSGIDNVEQVEAAGSYPVVVKVDAWSTSFYGAPAEGYALATEEGFSAASGPAFSLGTSSYSQCVGDQWTVNVTVYNNGDLAAHSVSVSLSIPTGLSIVSGSNPQNVGTIGAGLNQTASWTLRADQAGSYSVPVNVSSSSYGETFTGSGSFSVGVSDVPPAPSLSSPSNGSSTCDTTPTFDWSSVSGATSYRIQVDNNAGFSSPEIDTTTSNSYYTPGTALSPGTYYWQVRSINVCGEGSWSSTWNVTILSVPSAPSLSSPSDGNTISDDTPTFSWGSVSGATSYRIQVDNNAGFSSPEIDTTTSSSNYTPTTALSPDTYYWRVHASNVCGDGSWSADWSFTIIPNNPPNEPSNPSPADGATAQDINVDLNWTGGDADAGDTVTYDVYFEANDSSPGDLICSDVSTPACDPGTLDYETLYYWYVVATDNHAVSTTGDIWDFSTAESAIYIYLPIILKNQ
jgi:serine protease AprX